MSTAHRKALADAAWYVNRYRIPGTENFDLSTVDPEFRWMVYPRLENLLAHVETTTSAQIGDLDLLQEIAEDVRFCWLLCSGNASLETRRNARTHVFDGAVERLGEVLFARPWEGLLPSLGPSILSDTIAALEACMPWFSQVPAPASQKYSAQAAATMIVQAREVLARLGVTPPGQCAQCRTQNDLDATFCKRCGGRVSSG